MGCGSSTSANQSQVIQLQNKSDIIQKQKEKDNQTIKYIIIITYQSNTSGKQEEEKFEDYPLDKSYEDEEVQEFEFIQEQLAQEIKNKFNQELILIVEADQSYSRYYLYEIEDFLFYIDSKDFWNLKEMKEFIINCLKYMIEGLFQLIEREWEHKNIGQEIQKKCYSFIDQLRQFEQNEDQEFDNFQQTSSHYQQMLDIIANMQKLSDKDQKQTLKFSEQQSLRDLLFDDDQQYQFENAIKITDNTIHQIISQQNGQEIIDNETLQVFSTKTNLPAEYQLEKEAYLKLYQIIGKPALIKHALTAELFNDEHNIILYDSPPNCSLQQYKEKVENNIELMKFPYKNLMYILKKGLEIVIFFKKYGRVHNDLTPNNLFICFDMENQLFQIKVCNFSKNNNSLQTNPGYKSVYFLSPLRNYTDNYGDIQDQPIFRNPYEKFKNEVYQVIRIFQYMALYEKKSEALNIFLHENPPTLDDLMQIQEHIEKSYSEEIQQSQQFSDIMNFLREKLLTEDYSFAELENFIEKIPINSFDDSNSICKEIIRNKRKKLERNYNYIDIALGSKTYIDLNGSNNEFLINRTDLMKQVITSFVKQVLILLGKDCCGKTQFLLELKKFLSKQNFKIIFFDIDSFCQNSEHLQVQIEDQVQNLLDYKGKLIFILDGFEKLNDKDFNFDLLLRFSELKESKIIISMSSWFMTENELLQKFTIIKMKEKGYEQQPQFFYITPFDSKQRDWFISLFREYTQKIHNNFVFENINIQITNERLKFIQENEQFQVINPYDLACFLVSFDSVKQSSQVISQIELYQLFLTFLYKEKIYKQIHDNLDIELQTYFQKNYQLYIVENLSIFEENDYTKFYEQIIEDLNIFNIVVCWKMFNLDLIYVDSEFLNEIGRKLGYTDLFIGFLIQCSPFNFQKKYHQYSYLNRVIFRYFLTKGIINDAYMVIDKKGSEIAIELLSKQIFFYMDSQLINKESEIFTIFSEYLKYCENQNQLLESLYQIVLASKDQSEPSYIKFASSNALSLLNHFNYSLCSKDFSDTNIQGAILKNSCLDFSNFDRANMTGTILSNCKIDHCSFDSTILHETDFGVNPTLTGHSKGIKCMDISKNNQFIATGSSDHTIIIWNIESCEQQFTLQGHTLEINCVSFSRDSQYLASSSSDKKIIIWQLDIGQQFKVIEADFINSISFNFDQTHVLTGQQYDNSLKLWSIEKAQDILIFNGHTKYITSVAFSPADKDLIASGSADKTLRLWNIDGSCKSILQGHNNIIESICFSYNGKFLTSGAQNGQIFIWRVDQSIKVLQIDTKSSRIYSISFSINQKYIAAGSSDGTVRICSVELGREIKRIKGHNNQVRGVHYTSDNKFLITSSNDSTIKLWPIDQRFNFMLPVKFIEGHSDAVTSISFSPDGKHLASCSYDKTIIIWDVYENKIKKRINDHLFKFNQLSYSPDGKQIAGASNIDNISIWSADQGQKTINLEGHKDSVQCLCFSKDGQYLVSASGYEDDRLIVWKLDDSPNKIFLKNKKVQKNCVSISCDNKLVASGDVNGEIEIWELDSKLLFANFENEKQSINAVTFNKNGSHIVSGCNDSHIRIQSILNKDQQIILKGHQDSVNSIQYSNDWNLIISGSSDMSVIIWSASHYNIIQQIFGHKERINSICFNPDGNSIASCSHDGSIRFYVQQHCEGSNIFIKYLSDSYGKYQLKYVFAHDYKFSCNESEFKNVKGLSNVQKLVLTEYECILE